MKNLQSGFNWNNDTNAGVFGLNSNNARTNTSSNVGVSLDLYSHSKHNCSPRSEKLREMFSCFNKRNRSDILFLVTVVKSIV